MVFGTESCLFIRKECPHQPHSHVRKKQQLTGKAVKWEGRITFSVKPDCHFSEASMVSAAPYQEWCTHEISTKITRSAERCWEQEPHQAARQSPCSLLHPGCWGLCVYKNQRKCGMKYFFIKAAAGVMPSELLKSPEKLTFCTHYIWTEGGMSPWQNECMGNVTEKVKKFLLPCTESVPRAAWSVSWGNS